MNQTIAPWRVLRGEVGKRLERERMEAERAQRRERVKVALLWIGCAVGVLAMWWPK